MSELAQIAAMSLLANETPERLRNLIKAGPQFLSHELKKNWLPPGWTEEKELENEYDQWLSPDSQAAADAAEADVRREEKAGQTWATLDDKQRRMFLESVRLLTLESGAEQDLRTVLELNLPAEPEQSEQS